MKTSVQCISCLKPKANLKCGLCQSDLCKSCTEFLDSDFFHYKAQLKPQLQQTIFCQSCYQSEIIPEIDLYNLQLEKARSILVFSKSQGKETRLIKRLENPIHFNNCSDEADITMKCAFAAVELNYNAIVDLDVKPTKVREGSYQTTSWSGSAIPVQLDPSKLLKDRSFESDPN